MVCMKKTLADFAINYTMITITSIGPAKHILEILVLPKMYGGAVVE